MTTNVSQQLSADLRTTLDARKDLDHAIERIFTEYIRLWPAEAGGLDAKLDSALDFFAKLERLEVDGLPRFEERFMRLLQDQSNQNLVALQERLDRERKAIRDRMELVNESLWSADYNPGTRLVIEVQDRSLDEVKAFRQSLRDALSQTLSLDKEAAESRFAALSALVKRFSSQDTPDRNWKALVLDVRLHVEFTVREMGLDKVEREVYHSGAGKSGGQRQKLAAACLAAALRYQLGGQDRALPLFSTVVLDEAFDKTDPEFTAAAMAIFRNFGFQMVVATPMRSVMTLEPFIGGACYVHIKDGKRSNFLQVAYDQEKQALCFSEDARAEADLEAA